MAKATCLTCLWEKETGKKVDTSRSKVAWGVKIGVSEAAIRRHLAHAPAVEAESESDPDDFLAAHDIPIEAVTSRGMSIRDAETGSWQKVSWQPNKAALIKSLQYDDLKASLDGWFPNYTTVQIGDEGHSTIVNAADLQIGKAMNRGGGTPETVARVRASIEKIAERIVRDCPSTIVLVDNGDPIENIFNASAQIVTNDLPLPEQIRVFRRLMLEAIKVLAPLAPRLIYVAVPSNHGQLRTGYKSPGGTVDADFGLEISYQIEDAIAENPYLTNVEFVRPDSLNEIAEVEVSGTKLAFHHGHQSSGPGGHGKWWANMSHARHPGWDADIMVVAHYHSLRMEQSGNARWIVGVSSSDAGSDWFTNRAGDYATQGITVFDVLNGGMPINLAIL